jgi:cellulose synthase/poly-beta-1,6-N-acetylglucosamine synthase-like glycosyltransferase
MWNLKFRKRVTQNDLRLDDDDLPTIDIMIPCYSEPTEIVQMTLNSCYDMDYPAHKITCYICDDGKNDAMRDMVHETANHYGGEMLTRYVARTKIPGVPHHAKAGNLNNCILNEGSTGQLIIVLDCDMLPEPCLARTVVPFFFKMETDNSDIERPISKAVFDEKMGLLQTPQAFYNLDSNDLLGQSYSYFYECVISGWDGSGCTPCCGTGVTFSRLALEAVGGFSTGSITEDFKTSLVIRSHGYKCKYFLQYMTRGVSPKELNAFMTQRLRWAVGAIQIVRNSNPLFVKGLPFHVRWLYFFSTIGMIYVVPICIMLLIMYGTIFAGAPISFGPQSFTDYLALGGTSMVLIMGIQFLISWRLSFSNFLRILQDSFAVSMLFIRAMLIGFFGLELGFAVTKKDVSFDLKANLIHAAPHIIIYFVTGLAAIKSICEILASKDFITIPWTSNYEVSMLYSPLCWTVSLWILISGPPRMVIYGYLRERREKYSTLKCTNRNVPVLQELPNTPLNIFPPLTPELWVKEEAIVEVDMPSGMLNTEEHTHDETTPGDSSSVTTIDDVLHSNHQSDKEP